MNEDLRIDESRGDVYDHVVQEATGHPDRPYIRHLNALAHSSEVAPAIRIDAQKALGSIATTYGLGRYAKIIGLEHSNDKLLDV